MSLVELIARPPVQAPVMVVAFDAWVDAGSASSAAATALAEGGETVATFDGDVLYDYRARRPTLDIVDGRPLRLEWPDLSIRYNRLGGREVMILTGPEPDFRWRQLAAELVETTKTLGVTEWISLGAIPAAVPHTRPVPVLGTESRPGLLRGNVRPGPEGLLRVPSAAISVLDVAIGHAGIPALGYFAQVPHYISGPYPAATVALLRAIEQHLGIELPVATLLDEVESMRRRLDTATALDEKTRTYIERLETMVDEERLPSGDELIGEIERFLRERGTDPGAGRIH